MKTILFASLVAVLTISLVQINDAEATNLNGSWTHNNVKIKCYVTGLTATSNVDACNDLTSMSNSALEQGALTLTTTTGSYDIATYAWNSCSCGVGRAVTNYNNGDIQYAYSVMNRSLSWEDSTVDTSTTGYDWKTAVAHETGHNIGLAHYSYNAYVMYASLGTNDADRTLTSHSKAHISSEYQ